jgi:UDP-N-acetylmuramoyl-L-alanyl-D-glutamate--2,6-diaminopimelate ligase
MTPIPLSLLAAGISNARLSGRPDILVQRLTADSRDVQPGDLFACIRGHHSDGHQFAAQAVAQGAVAIMADRPLPGLDPKVGVLEVADVVQTLKHLAPLFYNYPALQMRMVGVTGTSGKTTTTHLLRAILEAERAGRKPAHRVGMIGTIHNALGGKVVAAQNTTPMAWDVQALLRQMVDNGCDTAVMEVSSHALAQDRVTKCEFDVAVFTNLTPEHLDFHRTMDDYAATKSKLFAGLAHPGYKPGPRCAVVNQDDPRGPEMARAARGADIRTFGLDHPADFTAEDIQMNAGGTAFRMLTPQGEIRVTWRFLGRYNILNALAAAAAAQCLGVPLRAIQRGLESIKGVPGRVERVAGIHPFAVLVDYAHKPDALLKVLRAVREFTPHRLIVVFGCGGERDTTKRAPMGEIAARLADRVIITSDNPRSEDPKKIIQEILSGCRRVRKTPEEFQAAIQVEPDRPLAIRMAMQMARPGDTVLLAGKGHENYQVVGNDYIPMDDYKLAQKELAALKNNPTVRKGKTSQRVPGKKGKTKG